MPCPLPHNHYCCSLPSPVCLPHLLICTCRCLISSPIAWPPSSVLCWCFFFFVFFLIFVICYISLWFICFVSFFFCWAYVKPHFRLVFQIYLLVFLWWLPLNCTNLVTLLFRVIVLVVYTGFICGKKITLSSVVVYILENFLLIWGLVLPFKFGFTIISQAFFSECWLVGLLERPVGLFTQRFTTSSNL